MTNGISAGLLQQTRQAGNLPRDQMDLLRGRLELLSGKDKVLMTMYVENGISFRQIARLCGLSETSVARRIRRIVERLTDGEYVVCLRHRDKLSGHQMAIARDFFLMSLSMRQISKKRRMSVYAVRKVLADIRDLVAAAEPASNHR